MKIKIIDLLNKIANNEEVPKKIKWGDLDSDDKEFFSRIYFDDVVNKYLEEETGANYSKLKWFYHRLSQLGVPYAIDSTLEKINSLTPIINDVCEYFISAAPNYSGALKDKGKILHSLLDSELVLSSEYFQMALINLFSKAKDLNHFENFARKFQVSSETIKREILFVAYTLKASAWIRDNKEKYCEFGIWTKRAFLIACSCLPQEERKFFFETARSELKDSDIMEKLIIRWAKDK